MDVTMRTKGKREIFENASDTADAKKNRHQMRMYSFKQLFNIMTTVVNRSELNDRVTANEEKIEKIFQEIELLKQEDKSIKQHTDREISDIRAKFSIYKEEQSATNGNLSTRIEDNLKSISQHRDILQKVNQEIKSIKQFSDGL